jgi:hypothetical protein
MSAPTPTSDIDERTLDVRLVPIQDLSRCSKRDGGCTALFDHLVGACKQCGWHGKPERFGGLEIDYKLVLIWRLYRKIAGFLALEALQLGCGLARSLWVGFGPTAREVAVNAPVIAVISCAHSWQYSLDHEQSLQKRLSRLVRPNFHRAASF